MPAEAVVGKASLLSRGRPVDFKTSGNVHVLFKCLDVDSGDGQKTIELEELPFGCRASVFHCRLIAFQGKQWMLVGRGISWQQCSRAASWSAPLSFEAVLGFLGSTGRRTIGGIARALLCM